jgi:hypothetical protein
MLPGRYHVFPSLVCAPCYHGSLKVQGLRLSRHVGACATRCDICSSSAQAQAIMDWLTHFNDWSTSGDETQGRALVHSTTCKVAPCQMAKHYFVGVQEMGVAIRKVCNACNCASNADT